MLICSFLQINLPDSVVKRFDHSITTYKISNECLYIVVIGGHREYDHSNHTNIPVTGSDILMIIELGMILIYNYVIYYYQQ